MVDLLAKIVAFNDIAVVIVILLGAFTGAVELIGRYRDAPGRALSLPGAILYIAVNVVAAFAGLIFLRTVGADLLKDYPADKRAIYEILIAGFGSLAFLRSSIFNIRLDGKDVSVGPAILLDVLLQTADRSVDRRRGADRAREVTEAMKEVSFDKAITALPPFCFALMQNVSQEAQSKILEEVKRIQTNVAIDPKVRSLLLGLLLMNNFSLNVVRAAVSEPGDQIKYDVEPPDAKATVSRAAQLVNEIKRRVGTGSGTGTPNPGGTTTGSRTTPEPTVPPASGQGGSTASGSGGGNGPAPSVTPSQQPG